MRASDSPQATIPPYLLTTSYRPDIVFYNESSSSVALLELTCPLDSVEHLKPARDQKQGKREYQELQPEFDRQGIPCFYDTIEISVLGHYLPASLSSFMNCVNFVQMKSRFLSPHQEDFDLAATISISLSRRIFMARDCPEWSEDA